MKLKYLVIEEIKNAYGKSLQSDVVAVCDTEHAAQWIKREMENWQAKQFFNWPNTLGMSVFHIGMERA
jgi:hypothetical protein